jgi:hypothetical protein
MADTTPTHHSTPSDRQLLVARLQAEAFLTEDVLSAYPTDVLRDTVEALQSWLDPAVVPLFLSRAQAGGTAAAPPGPRPHAAQRAEEARPPGEDVQARAPTGEGVPPGGDARGRTEGGTPDRRAATATGSQTPSLPAAVRDSAAVSTVSAIPVGQTAETVEKEINVVALPSPSVDHPPVNDQPVQATASTDLELAALADLDSKLLVATDRIRMVARFETAGFYWHGRPGTGKTNAVLATLEELGIKYHYHKGYITAQGLLELMELHFDEVIVLDDVSAIFDDKKAVQYLLAALGRLQGRALAMSYVRAGQTVKFKFLGGIICISNLAVEDKGMLSAFRSRVHTLGHEPSDLSLVGLARHRICQEGWTPDATSRRNEQIPPKPKSKPRRPGRTSPKKKQPVQGRRSMTPEECNQVIDWAAAESRRLNVRFDLRVLFDKALPDYLAWREGKTKAHWKDLVTTTLQEEVGSLAYTPPGGVSRSGVRQATKAQEQEIVRAVLKEFSNRRDRIWAWKERTKALGTQKSEKAFDRRWAEVKAQDKQAKDTSQ